MKSSFFIGKLQIVLNQETIKDSYQVYKYIVYNLLTTAKN